MYNNNVIDMDKTLSQNKSFHNKTGTVAENNIQIDKMIQQNDENHSQSFVNGPAKETIQGYLTDLYNTNVLCMDYSQSLNESNQFDSIQPTPKHIIQPKILEEFQDTKELAELKQKSDSQSTKNVNDTSSIGLGSNSISGYLNNIYDGGIDSYMNEQSYNVAVTNVQPDNLMIKKKEATLQSTNEGSNGQNVNNKENSINYFESCIAEKSFDENNLASVNNSMNADFKDNIRQRDEGVREFDASFEEIA